MTYDYDMLMMFVEAYVKILLAKVGLMMIFMLMNQFILLGSDVNDLKGHCLSMEMSYNVL